MEEILLTKDCRDERRSSLSRTELAQKNAYSFSKEDIEDVCNYITRERYKSDLNSGNQISLIFYGIFDDYRKKIPYNSRVDFAEAVADRLNEKGYYAYTYYHINSSNSSTIWLRVATSKQLHDDIQKQKKQKEHKDFFSFVFKAFICVTVFVVGVATIACLR